MAATVERARAQKYLRAAHIASNEARACCNELLNIDMNLLARSRDMIANAGRRLTQKQENPPPRLYPIDRKMLERHLQRAEAHVAKAGQHIIQQREMVARLEGRGHAQPANDGERRNHVGRRHNGAEHETDRERHAEQPMRHCGHRAGGEDDTTNCQQRDRPQVETKLSSWRRPPSRSAAAGSRAVPIPERALSAAGRE